MEAEKRKCSGKNCPMNYTVDISKCQCTDTCPHFTSEQEVKALDDKERSENLAKVFSRAAGTVDTRGTDAVVDMAMVVFGIDKSERQKLEILFEAYVLENMKQSIKSAIGRKENG